MTTVIRERLGEWLRGRREQPLDQDDDSALSQFAADLRRLREKAGSPTYRELGRVAHYSAATLSQAASGKKLPSLAVTLAYVRACDGDAGPWEERWHAVAEEEAAAELVEVGDQRSPYVGLTAFQAADSDRFFGRERMIDALVSRLSDHRMVAVCGASGAGKSSLLRAGLLARTGRTVLFTPGAHPVEECAIQFALLTGGTPGPLQDELERDSRGLHRLVRQVAGDGDELVIVVDQFEEIFTLCRDGAERARFVDLLAAASRAENSRCRIVLGVRADFYSHCTAFPELIEAFRDAQLPVGPMTADELRRAITQPAVGAGCAVETALVSRLVADATGQPGVLPLLSHALLETWRRRRGATLTIAGYEAAGGIDRAVARTAEVAYTALGAEHQRLAKQIFLRLSALGEGTEDTKRRVRRDELDDPDTDEVLTRLTDARLLTVDHDSIEISHEALIRSWPRLRGWLTEDRDGFRIHRQLTEATEAWVAVERDPGALYRGARLAITREWVGTGPRSLSAREREFLDASVATEAHEQHIARRRTRRLKQLVALLSVLLLVTATSLVAAFLAQSEATEQRNLALAQKVAAQATALRASDAPLAAQLSLAAYRLAATTETRGSLLSAFTQPFTARLDHEINTTAFTQDGRVLATGGDDRTIRLWDRTTPHRPVLLAELPGQPDDVESLVFAEGGRLLVGGEYDGSVRIWDTGKPRAPGLLAAFAAHADPVFAARLSQDGRLLATASSDHTVRLWDLSDPRRPARLAELTGHTDTVWTAVFSPDGRVLATASDDRTAKLWDVADPRAPRLLSSLTSADLVKSVAFGPDGRTLAVAGYEHSPRLWDITDPVRPVGLSELVGHPGPLQAVAFSPDGRTVATGGWDQTIRLWDTANLRAPTPLTTLTGHTNTIWSLTFSPDGHTLASASSDHTALLTDIPGPVLAGHPAAIDTGAFSPDDTVVAVGTEDNTARLWDVTDSYFPKPLPVLAGPAGQLKSVAFSPDGSVLAAASIDGTVGRWEVSERPRTLPALPTGQESLRAAVFSPVTGLLAAASNDGNVYLWDAADPRQAGFVGVVGDGRADALTDIAFTPDGRTLVAAAVTEVRVWDLTDPRAPVHVTDFGGHEDTVQSVAISADGRRLATASLDRTVRLWDITNRGRPRPLSVLVGHTGAVRSVAFAPDGRTVASASTDHTARLWDVADPDAPALLGILDGHTDRVYSVAFSHNGRILLTTAEDRTARLWDTSPDRVASRICATAYPRITRSEWERYFPGLDYQPPCQ